MIITTPIYAQVLTTAKMRGTLHKISVFSGISSVEKCFPVLAIQYYVILIVKW